jgi:hypothetical protein
MARGGCRKEKRKSGGTAMTEFLGWIQCAGHRVLVERVDEDEKFHVVRLCMACGAFDRGHELRVPKCSFVPCARYRIEECA